MKLTNPTTGSDRQTLGTLAARPYAAIEIGTAGAWSFRPMTTGTAKRPNHQRPLSPPDGSSP